MFIPVISKPLLLSLKVTGKYFWLNKWERIEESKMILPCLHSLRNQI